MTVSLSALSWQTPDGAPLFSNLTLSFGAERTGLVGRNGSGKTTLLRLIAGELSAHSGRIHRTGRIGYLPQDLRSRADDALVDLFGAREALAVLDRAEAGRAEADELALADWTLPARIASALAQLDLRVELSTPLANLSGGQRTRAALAALLIDAPDFLILDEPTNNLDAEGRAAVRALLAGWQGGALVVSHDRDLLEQMDAIVDLSGLGAARYGGGYTAYRARKDLELAAADQALAEAEKLRELAARRAREAAERKARKDAKGARGRAKGDQPKILMDFAKGRAEASGGAGARLRDARKFEAETAVTEARGRIEIIAPVRMEIPPTGLPAGRSVLELVEASLWRGEKAVFEGISLQITGPQRVVLSGPNGSGKTTLIKALTGKLALTAGRAAIHVPWALLDQHVAELGDAESLRDAYLRLNPAADANDAHTALARFGFRASEAARLGRALSGGERLRAGLACTLGGRQPPMLLILDEPTNHLDLDAITALEAALDAYDGAVLAISHDQSFLTALRPDRIVTLDGR